MWLMVHVPLRGRGGGGGGGGAGGAGGLGVGGGQPMRYHWESSPLKHEMRVGLSARGGVLCSFV